MIGPTHLLHPSPTPHFKTFHGYHNVINKYFLGASVRPGILTRAPTRRNYVKVDISAIY
jgi:hypothetical protein